MTLHRPVSARLRLKTIGSSKYPVAVGDAFEVGPRWIALEDAVNEREYFDCVDIWTIKPWKRKLWFKLSPGASRVFKRLLVWGLLK